MTKYFAEGIFSEGQHSGLAKLRESFDMTTTSLSVLSVERQLWRSTLPLEIVYLVIDAVGEWALETDIKREETLCKCALVCRAILTRSLTNLYGCIEVGSRRRLISLMRIGYQYAHVNTLLKSTEKVIVTGSTWAGAYHTLLCLHNLCPNVKALSLHFVNLKLIAKANVLLPACWQWTKVNHLTMIWSGTRNFTQLHSFVCAFPSLVAFKLVSSAGQTFDGSRSSQNNLHAGSYVYGPALRDVDINAGAGINHEESLATWIVSGPSANTIRTLTLRDVAPSDVASAGMWILHLGRFLEYLTLILMGDIRIKRLGDLNLSQCTSLRSLCVEFSWGCTVEAAAILTWPLSTASSTPIRTLELRWHNVDSRSHLQSWGALRDVLRRPFFAELGEVTLWVGMRDESRAVFEKGRDPTSLQQFILQLRDTGIHVRCIFISMR